MQITDDKKAESEGLFQRLKELFWETPFRNSVSLLTLLITVASALVLIFKQSPLMIVALVHLLPLVVVITDSVRDKLAGKPLRWPTWLLVMVYGAALIGTGGLPLSVFGTWEGNIRPTHYAKKKTRDTRGRIE